MSDEFHYTGRPTLEILSEAYRYNQYLEDLIHDFMTPYAGALDFGAGIGTFADRLRKRGIHVDCIEPDAEQRHVIESRGLSADASIGPNHAARYDRVYTLNVLEHIEDDVAALKALYTAIKPGGRLLIFVPAFQALYSSFDAAVGHVRRYHREELRSRVESAGFTCLSLRYVDSIGFFAWLAMKTLGRDSGTLNPKAVKFYDRWIFPLSLFSDRLLNRWFGKNLLLVAEKI